jgi:hypothetical protein
MPDITQFGLGTKTGNQINLYNIRRRGQVPCQTYPAARQMGFGSDTQGRLVSSPVYFWGNSGGGIIRILPSKTIIRMNAAITCTLRLREREEDFFVDTEKPGYKPYAYPHPLRAGGSGPTPTPNPTPTATPTPPPPTPTPATPTPTPRPTVTPTPTLLLRQRKPTIIG